MPEQQQDQQKNAQRPSGSVDKTGSGKPGTKNQDQKKKSMDEGQDESSSSCGPGTCS